MTTLHIINKPLDDAIRLKVQATAGLGDAVLLIEDGVISCLHKGNDESGLQSWAKRYTIYALDTDVQARGIQNRLPKGVIPVDFEGFVTLTVQHTRTLSWF